MSLMASPSSFPSRNYKFDAFASFHGPDVRKTLLSHMRKQFNFNGITMFDDQGIERSNEIAPSLNNAIIESRILIVILSKKYSSSSWCLDELVEILKGKKATQQIVMTIFYGVDPSDVRNQTGDFGIAFNETFARRTDEERHKWSKALKEVGNIAGEDFFRWDNEANMIEKIARDVSDKLNTTPSREFDGMVGLESHLREMESLLDLDNDGGKMVAIIGPAGIGKTTIAKSLLSKLSNRFQLSCFVENIRGSCLSGLHELRLQETFISKVLNQDGIKICHSGVIEERLCKQRVLIILDDVNHIKQLKTLANETTWFGSGSRIVVTTENKELLHQHGINDTYQVRFPSHEEAVKILCGYAFRKNSLYHGFERHVHRVTKLCGNLPLGLSVVGLSLRGKNEDEWEDVVSRLETVLDPDIEDVLRVGYESLDENGQTLFLHIAIFFNNRDDDFLKTMFAGSDLNVKYGLKILKSRSLIEITSNEIIVMHRLLQQMGKNIIHKQDPWKRQILLDSPQICDVLEQANGTRNVVGISFDISGIKEVSISKKAFKRMSNLRFLKVYKSKYDGNDRMHIPEEMEFPRGLRLLHWHAYPSKSLPPTFNPEYLVELSITYSKVEKLWKGTQPLKNLKKMSLTESKKLKELPDFTNATNLEELHLSSCESLVEIPTSFSYLHNLRWLWANDCINLQVIPAHMNLASLQSVYLNGCLRLKNIPAISTNMGRLTISQTSVEGVPPSIRFCSNLRSLSLSGRGILKGVRHLPPSLTYLELSSNSDFERIPDCIKALPLLSLHLNGCRRLTSLPELPGSLRILSAEDCESLDTVFCTWNIHEDADLNFINCFKLCQQARRAIIQRPHGVSLLPGSEMPAEFDQRGKGNLLTIHLDGNRSYTEFMFCVVIRSIHSDPDYLLVCCRKGQGDLDPVEEKIFVDRFKFRTEHLFIFHSSWLHMKPFETNGEIEFEFNSKYQGFEVIECGAKILTEESIKEYYESGLDQVFEEETIDGDRTDCWSWLFLCFGSGRRR